MAVPIIGGIAAAAEQKARNVKLHDLTRSRQFTPNGPFVEALRTALIANGYEAKAVDLPRSGFGYFEDYGTLSGADAWLDCVGLQWGYAAAGVGADQPYRPTVWAKCQLVRAADRTVLMREIVMYNSFSRSAAFVSVSPDPAYAFVDTDALVADPDRMIAGIDTALRGTARAFANRLK